MGAISRPAPAVINSLPELKRNKIEEIRREALRVGQAGAKIVGCADPYTVFHMAVTPDDVGLLQQANQVAKMEAEMASLPPDSPYRIAEIKEKWYEGSEEKTRLHTAVPEKIHDAVLYQAAMHAGEIYRRQEILIQMVQDAGTPEGVEAIHWGMNLPQG